MYLRINSLKLDISKKINKIKFDLQLQSIIGDHPVPVKKGNGKSGFMNFPVEDFRSS